MSFAEKLLNTRSKIDSELKKLSSKAILIGLLGILLLNSCTSESSASTSSIDLENNAIFQNFSKSVVQLVLRGSGCSALFIGREYIDGITQNKFLITSHCVLNYDASQIGTQNGYAEVTPKHGAEAGIAQTGRLINFTTITTSAGFDSEVSVVNVAGSSEFLKNTSPYPIELIGGPCSPSENTYALVTGKPLSPDSIVNIENSSVEALQNVQPHFYVAHKIDYIPKEGESGSTIVAIEGPGKSKVCYLVTGYRKDSGYVTDLPPSEVIVDAANSLTIPSIIYATP